MKNTLSIPTIQKGELEAISLAVEMKIDIIMMDDYVAFRRAKEHGLSPLKSFDLLIMAKKKGLISSIRDTLDVMKQNNEGIDPVQYDKMVSMVDE